MAFHRTDLFFVAERLLSLGRRFNANVIKINGNTTATKSKRLTRSQVIA